MSDTSAPLGGEGGSDPGQAGQVESPPAQPDAPPPEPIDYLEVDDDLAQKHVRVKIDGQEQSVPLREALEGYQRQSVFTQRTQELAEQRRQHDDAVRLHHAMQANPGLTVQILANHAGMSVHDFLGLTPAQQQAAVAAEPEYDDPLERELALERQAREALEQRFVERETNDNLARAVHGLQQQYGLNDDQVRAVVGTAMQMNLGIEYLPLVYQAMAFQANQQVLAQQAQNQQTEEQRRQQAAQQAAAVVGNGAGVTPGASASANAGYRTYRDAINAAFDEVEKRHGG